jgi:hypothetical protein
MEKWYGKEEEKERTFSEKFGACLRLEKDGIFI